MSEFDRRDLFKLAGAAGMLGLAGVAQGADPAKPKDAAAATEAAKPNDGATPGKNYRIGVISASILGKPQPRNGHTWLFAQYFHPEFDFEAFKRINPQAYPSHVKVYRSPSCSFGRLPFPDTKITHYYDADHAAAKPFTEVFTGVQVATSLEKMVDEVDAIWLGDASGLGEDHFDLLAPGLAKGLPTFCDKPIGGTVAETKRILDFAKKHKAPIMSSSIFRHEWGMGNALRMRDSKEFGHIEHVSARLQSRYSLPGWMIYGQHPVWTVMTLMGAGVDSVSMYEYKDTCHALITWPDRYPCHVWFGQPYERFEYDRTDVYFKKKLFNYTASIDGDFTYGHHYQMFNMAETFLKMVRTGIEPVPHQEILEVNGVVYAGAKSLKEQSRLVKLAEVMG